MTRVAFSGISKSIKVSLSLLIPMNPFHSVTTCFHITAFLYFLLATEGQSWNTEKLCLSRVSWSFLPVCLSLSDPYAWQGK